MRPKAAPCAHGCIPQAHHRKVVIGRPRRFQPLAASSAVPASIRHRSARNARVAQSSLGIHQRRLAGWPWVDEANPGNVAPPSQELAGDAGVSLFSTVIIAGKVPRRPVDVLEKDKNSVRRSFGLDIVFGEAVGLIATSICWPAARSRTAGWNGCNVGTAAGIGGYHLSTHCLSPAEKCPGRNEAVRFILLWHRDQPRFKFIFHDRVGIPL